MAKVYPVQSSFAAGEVTPKLYGRFDTPGYQQGLFECTNMIIDSRGPVLKRAGTQFVFSVPGKDARLFEFNYSRELTFVTVLTHQLITIDSPTGDSIGPNYITNPGFIFGLNGWTVGELSGGAVSVSGDLLELEPGKNAGGEASVSQTFTLADSAADHVILMTGTFNSPAGTPLEVRIGTTGDGSFDLLQAPMIDNGTTYQFTISGPLAASITVTIYAQGWGVGGNPDTSSFIDSISIQEIIPASATFTAPTPYLETELEQVQNIMHPDGKTMYLFHNNHPIQRVVYDPTAAPPTWLFQPHVLVAQPAEWVVGSYPNTSNFFQGRQWFAGTPNDPETFWASMSGDYADLSIGVNADDALKFTIADHGQIFRITSSKDLLLGTALKEFIVTSDQGVITPSDVKVEVQSSYGSAPIQGALLGTEALYISSDSTKLRSQWYQWTEAGYLSRDITYTNDHITKAQIRHLTYQREPEQIIWMPLRDGTLVGCTYHRDGNDKPIFGWHKHKFPGAVKDAVSIQQGPEIAIVLAIHMFVNGVDEMHLVIADNLVEPEAGNSNDPKVTDARVYLDDYKFYASDGVTTVITGLDHLEGMEVQPVVDEAIENLKMVVGGQITLDNPGIEIAVGLPYSGKMVTLPLVTEAPGGSSAGWSKQRNNIFVRCVNSAKPLINGDRPPERKPITPMDRPEPDEAFADFQVRDLGYSRNETITVEQDLPRSLNVLAIFGEVQQESL